MLTYNTQLKHLVLPEYGRNIQKMVEYCLTIEDKGERTNCAKSIIKCMLNLFPEIKGSEEDELKLWDHLAIMSGFQLDVDYPGERIDASNLNTAPAPVPYTHDTIRYRHYGKVTEAMVERAASMDDGEEKDYLVECLANHMKKTLVVNTAEDVDDEKVFNDLLTLSHGRINLVGSDMKLHEFKAMPQATTGKKKKKK